MSPPIKPTADDSPDKKWPNWVQRVMENSIVGGTLLLVFTFFVQPLTENLNEVNQAITRINDRLYSIEKKTETLIAIGNEKIARLEVEYSKLMGLYEASKDRTRELENRVLRLELRKTKELDTP